MSTIHKLEIEFAPKMYDLIISTLHDLEQYTLQEGRSNYQEDQGATLSEEESLITCYFESKEDANNLQNSLHTILAEKIKTHLLELENDYQDRWKDFAKPIIISENILIKPSWIEESTLEDEFLLKKFKSIIDMDPGYAFGSGSHETTILCAKAIENECILNSPKSLLDIGCGSGILSIIGKKLSISLVHGTDIDPTAIESAIDNAKRNDTDPIHFSLNTLSQIDQTFDIVVANILSSTLKELYPLIYNKCTEGGLIILSGILASEHKNFLECLQIKDYIYSESGEWCCVLIRKE